MFRITQYPSSGSIDSYLIKTTCIGSTVLLVWAVGVFRCIQDLWCVCAQRAHTRYLPSVIYPACKPRLFCVTLYYRRWLVRFYHNFPHYLINRISGKKNIECKMCVLTVSINLSKIFPNLRRIQPRITNIHRSSYKTPLILVTS
jgi:hypothetical protein